MKKHETYFKISFLLISIMLCCCKKETLPKVVTLDIKDITQNTAECGGYACDDGGSDIYNSGLCLSTSTKPTVKDSVSSYKNPLGFRHKIINLLPNTTYYIRAYAINGKGIGYGNTICFTTLQAVLPELKSYSPLRIGRTEAKCRGQVLFDGGIPITRGICWSTHKNPTINDNKTSDNGGIGKFTHTISGLTPSSTYYSKAYVTNSLGTIYGHTMVIRTMNGEVTDIDGNVYQTVLIGDQEWLAENLKVTHYRNGDAIPNINQYSEEESYHYLNDYWCVYNNNKAYKDTFGLLYNYFATADKRGVCPAGWHVPSDDEWQILENYLGADSAGYKLLKSKDYISIYAGDNSSGFGAQQGGVAFHYNYYERINYGGGLWSTTPYEIGYLGRCLEAGPKFSKLTLLSYNSVSIRCLKDK